MDIINHIHTFMIGNDIIEVKIDCIGGYWTSKIVRGDTGTAGCYGGEYGDLAEYIKDIEKQHRYSYNFFNYGYKYAKDNN